MSDEPLPFVLKAFGLLVQLQVDDICRSATFGGSEILQNLLRFLVQQTGQGEKTTEAVLASLFVGNSEKKPRQNVSRLRKLLNTYYDSKDSDTALIVIAIPRAGLDLQSRTVSHYEVTVSFHEAIRYDAATFAAAMRFKYGIPNEDGEAWFNTGEEPASLTNYVVNSHVSRAIVMNILGRIKRGSASKEAPATGKSSTGPWLPSSEEPFFYPTYPEANLPKPEESPAFQPIFSLLGQYPFDYEELADGEMPQTGEKLCNLVSELFRTFKNRDEAVDFLMHFFGSFLLLLYDKLEEVKHLTSELSVFNGPLVDAQRNMMQYVTLRNYEGMIHAARTVSRFTCTKDFAALPVEEMPMTLNRVIRHLFIDAS